MIISLWSLFLEFGLLAEFNVYNIIWPISMHIYLMYDRELSEIQIIILWSIVRSWNIGYFPIVVWAEMKIHKSFLLKGPFKFIFSPACLSKRAQ